MKKLLIALAALVVVIVVVILVLPLVVPKDALRAQVERQVEAATGREVTIAGDVGVSILPSVGLSLEEVSIANVAGAANPAMAELAALRLEVGLLPLLSGELVVDEFVLVEPVIRLEVDEQGNPNWAFETADAQEPAPAEEEETAGEGAADGGGGFLNQISLGDVELRDGTVVYLDRRTGAEQRVENVDLRLALPNLDQPFHAEGELTWNAEPIDLALDVVLPRALFEGGTTDLTASIASKHVDLDFDGSATGGTPLRLAGAAELAVPSVRALAAWTGTPLDMEGDVLGPFNVEGQVALAGPVVSFTEATIALDDIRAEGEVAVDTGGEVPRIRGTLDVAALDANPYLGGDAAADDEADAAPEAGPAASEGWSEEPIDLSALNQFNVNFTLQVASLRVRDIEIGETALHLTLEDGRLTADLTEMALYDGSGTATLIADASGEVPSVALDFDLAGMQAEPLLAAAAGVDRITGTAEGSVAVEGRGRSQAEIVAGLNGSGSIRFEDGAIKGINLAAMLRNISSAFLDSTADETQQTDFTEIAGTFTISDGVLRNDDLQLLSPLLRVTGQGRADLLPRTVDYRLTPRLVATAEGQGGDADAAGLMVPVLITGPWSDLSFRPDVSGIVEQTLQNPGGVEDTVRGLIGRDGEEDGEAGGAGAGEGREPGDIIRGLLRGRDN